MGKLFYALFTLGVALFLFAIFYTPYLAHRGDPIVPALYDPGFSWACHQKISRSQCLFADGAGGFFVADCFRQAGEYVPNDNRIVRTVNEAGNVGYKLPVCARDIGIYGAVLLGALVYPFARKLEDARVPPAIYLLLAIIPIGFDGGMQLLGELGIFGDYESTNLTRVVTGAIAGIVLPFYIFPLFNHYMGKKEKTK